LCQGHIVMHVAMFISSFLVDKRQMDLDYSKLSAWDKSIFGMFEWSAWLHLATAIL
jgi:hypothetical protein